MALTARFTEQMPFVATPQQMTCVREEATIRGVSVAQVIRDAIDARYSLHSGEVLPEA